jgi:hypothetical protein
VSDLLDQACRFGSPDVVGSPGQVVYSDLDGEVFQVQRTIGIASLFPKFSPDATLPDGLVGNRDRSHCECGVECKLAKECVVRDLSSLSPTGADRDSLHGLSDGMSQFLSVSLSEVGGNGTQAFEHTQRLRKWSPFPVPLFDSLSSLRSIPELHPLEDVDDLGTTVVVVVLAVVLLHLFRGDHSGNARFKWPARLRLQSDLAVRSVQVLVFFESFDQVVDAHGLPFVVSASEGVFCNPRCQEVDNRLCAPGGGLYIPAPVAIRDHLVIRLALQPKFADPAGSEFVVCVLGVVFEDQDLKGVAGDRSADPGARGVQLAAFCLCDLQAVA